MHNCYFFFKILCLSIFVFYPLFPPNAFARSSAIELHNMICHPTIEQIVDSFSPKDRKPQERYVYYFDNKQLDLFQDHVIIRLRAQARKSDLTVKIRSPSLERIAGKWFGLSGFKCESDRYGKNPAKMACSLKVEISPQATRALLSQQKTLLQTLSEEQKDFLRSYSHSYAKVNQTNILGPVYAYVWTPHILAGKKFTLEYWLVSKQIVITEFSIKTNAQQENRDEKDFLSYLNSQQFSSCSQQGDKTEAVLKYFGYSR